MQPKPSLLCHADQLNLCHSVFVSAETDNLCCKKNNLCQNVFGGFQCDLVYSLGRVLYCQMCSVQFIRTIQKSFILFLLHFFFFFCLSLLQVLY